MQLTQNSSSKIKYLMKKYKPNRDNQTDEEYLTKIDTQTFGVKMMNDLKLLVKNILWR